MRDFSLFDPSPNIVNISRQVSLIHIPPPRNGDWGILIWEGFIGSSVRESVCACKSCIRSIFFFIMKHLKFLHVLHTNIAYDLNMCHKIDQRSKGRSQENCKTRDLVISLNEETL